MSTKPVSEIVPLAEWVQAYHVFKAKLDTHLYQTGMDLVEMHLQALGEERSPNVWEKSGYRVRLEGQAVTFEVSEEATADEALAQFRAYQEWLFAWAPGVDDS